MSRKYVCSRCGAQGHGKDDCGRSRIPTAPHSLPLPAVAAIAGPNSGGPAPTLRDMHSLFVQYRADDDFLAPAAGPLLADEADASIAIPRELQATATHLMRALGTEGNQASRILQDVAASRGLHRDTRIVPGNDAATTVSALLPATEDTSHDALLNNIRSGRTLLTYSELAVLEAVRDETLARQQLDYLAPLDAGNIEWIPPVEQRRCTVCGQFVGTLGSHPCDLRKAEAELQALERRGRRETKISLPTLDATGRVVQRTAVFTGLKEIDDAPIDLLQDAYLATAGRGQAEFLSGLVIMSYCRKPLFGEPRLQLPMPLRAAYLQQPTPFVDASSIAELIDPPFERYEVQRLIEQLDARQVLQLINSPRTRDDALYILSNTPTRAGHDLALSGQLPDEVVAGMATSGDQAVRRQAAIAANLGDIEAEALATDPDPDVRAALLYGTAAGRTDFHSHTTFTERLIVSGVDRPRSMGHREIDGVVGTMYRSVLTKRPHLLVTYINDPDQGLAFGALAAMPYSRQALYALSQVTSRKRLEAIAANLDRIWPYFESSRKEPGAGDSENLPDAPGAREIRQHNMTRRMGISIVEAQEARANAARIIAERLGASSG